MFEMNILHNAGKNSPLKINVPDFIRFNRSSADNILKIYIFGSEKLW